MYPYHAGAGAGWQDYVIAAFEFLEDFERQRLRSLLVAGVIARLAAAGLGRWYCYFTTGRLQQTQCREPDARSHQVHETGDKQASAHAGSFYIVCRRFVQHTLLRIMKARVGYRMGNIRILAEPSSTTTRAPDRNRASYCRNTLVISSSR